MLRGPGLVSFCATCGVRRSQLEVRRIDYRTAKRFIARHHVDVVMPPTTYLALGALRQGKLVGVAAWGHGANKEKSIRAIFPRVKGCEFFELGRFCMRDEEPKNAESHFLAQCVEYIRWNRPEIKVLLTYADGRLGKVGYIYQASNWWYAGALWTRFYLTRDGRMLPPRYLGCRRLEDRRLLRRLGIRRVRAKLLRYVCLLGTAKDVKRLIASAVVPVSKVYPKRVDLVWYAGEGSRVSHRPPRLKGRFDPCHPLTKTDRILIETPRYRYGRALKRRVAAPSLKTERSRRAPGRGSAGAS